MKKKKNTSFLHAAHKESPLLTLTFPFVQRNCKYPLSLDTGPLTSDINVSIACSVVTAVKHVIALVCTWKQKDVDKVYVEELLTSIAKTGQ